MAIDLNTEIKIGADATGVEAGVGRAKRSLADLGQSAKKAGQDAGAGIGAIGAGGDKAAKDVERATKNIQGQLQRAVASFEAGERGSRKFYESLARQRGADLGSLKPLLDQLDAYKSKSEAASQASAKVGTSFTGLGAAAGLAARAVAAIGIGASVGEFVKMADASTNVASRLGLVTSSAAELASVQQRLFTIAQSSRVSFVDLVGTYAQVARSTKDLGVSQAALLGVIQTISQAVTISGGSAASAQAALTQLSQGFASGALRGEELNSILEQTPRLAQALADGLGVGVGKLRELGQAGELTSEKVLGALEKSAASVAAEFGKMAVTVEQASTNAANSVLRLTGAFDKLLGVTSALGGAIQSISSGLDFLSADVEKLGGQGPLRDAAREVINLDAAAKRLRTGMQSGVLGPNAQGELDRINARLAEAKQRFRELDQQLSGVRDPRDQSGFTGRGTSYANEAARLAKLRDDANAFRLNQSGVPASYLKDMAELIRLNQAGVIVGKEYDTQLKAMQDTLLKKTGVTKSANAAAKESLSEYDKLIKKLSDELPKAAAEAEAAQMGYNKSQTEFLALAGSPVWASFTNSQRAVVASMFEGKIASEQAGDAVKELSKAYTEAAAERIKTIQSMERAADGLQSQNDALRDEIELIGLSTEQQTLVLQQRNDVIILTKEATLAELERQSAITGTQTRVEIALASEIEALKERNALLGAKGVKNAAVDAAKTAADEWQKTTDSINQSLTDALLRAFESGKDFAQALKTTLINMFKTLVLRPIISAVVNPVAGAITGALGLSGAANAGSSALSTAGSIGSGYSALAGIGGAFGGGLSGGFGGLMGSLGLSATGSTLGGALSAGGIALQSGNILGGLGTLVGALGPIALGIGVLASIFGKDKSGTYHTGGAGSYSAAGGASTGAKVLDQGLTFGVRYKDYNSQAESAAVGISQSIVGMLDATAKSFGNQAGYFAATAFADDSSKDGAWGSLIIKRLDDTVTNWADTQTSKWAPKVFADGEAGQKEYSAALALSVRDALVGAVEGVDWAQSLLTGLGDAPSLEGLQGVVATINAAQEAFKGFGQYMPTFASLAESAVSKLAQASGGVEALAANMSTFVDNFYSDGEKLKVNTENVRATMAALGFEMPTTREGFKTLVQAQMALGDAGAKALAGLLGVSGAFAAVTAASVDAVQAAKDLAAAQAERRESAYSALQRSISAQNKALQNQLDAARDVAGTLDGLFDILSSNVRELYGTVDSTRAMQARQGNDFIEQALATARASGYLPDADKLAEAIGAARGELDVSNYGGSQAERDYAALVLAGKLSGLEGLAEKQLTGAQRTVRALEAQIDQGEQTLDYWREQIDIASGTYEGVLSVTDAVNRLSGLLGPSAGPGTTGKPGGGGGGTAGLDGVHTPRVSYGADEALTSFDKFKGWYQGLRNNADSSLLMGDGYQVPDWLRVSGMARDGTDSELFKQYTFFKNNSQYASDFENIMTKGRSGHATDGSTLVKSDLSKMPPEVAEYFKKNRNDLLQYEGSGLDPVLAYQLQRYGPEHFGLDQKKDNFTEWLRNNQWTAGGVVAGNNASKFASMDYASYNLAKWDTATGTLIFDGGQYTPDGKLVGGSALYNSMVGGGGYTASGYYTSLKQNLDQAINDGKSAQSLVDSIRDAGASMQDVATAYGISLATLEENLRNGGATNIPKFDVGTNYVPRDMLAYIHKGEAVVPKAYNPAANGAVGAGNAELVAEVRLLRQEVAALRSAGESTADSSGRAAAVLVAVQRGNSLSQVAEPAF